MFKDFISWCSKRRATNYPMIFPLGHFYSPVADPRDLFERERAIWKDADSMPGIDMRVQEQLELLQKLVPYVSSINYPQERPKDDAPVYFYQNDQYPRLDAEFLFSFLCHRKPKRMIEIGSGFSSLITADVNLRMLGNSLDFTCVEPFPRQFLVDGVNGIGRLIQEKVENLDLSFFDELKNGDVLFIDSSHVCKTGSDVNYLFFEVLPRLKTGVIVHFHDIFLPLEYPKKWVLEEGRNWNEQYILRAFLQFNCGWKIIWMSYYMGIKHRQAVQAVFSKFTDGSGGSFWIERL